MNLRITLLPLLLLAMTFLGFPQPDRKPDTETLTLSQAIRKVLKSNPELAPYDWEIKAKEALIYQESRRPNPEVEVEVENFAGSNETKGFDGAEYTFLVSQEILLGGKRKKRIDTATLEKSLSQRDLDIKKADLLLETKKRFLTILFLQEKLKLRQEMLKLGKQLIEKIEARIVAGRTSSAELTRAQVSLARETMEQTKLEQEISVARFHLAALWGSSKPGFLRVAGDLTDGVDVPLPEYNQLHPGLEENSQIKRLASEAELLRSTVRLEEAARVPDVTVAGGIRRMNDAHSTAFVFNISLPVPIFNKNKGNIQSARYFTRKAEAELQATRTVLSSRLNLLLEQLKLSAKHAEMLKTTVMPKAKETYELISKGYGQGKYDYLEVLEAYRTQLEVQQEYLEAVFQFRQIKADIQRLTA